MGEIRRHKPIYEFKKGEIVLGDYLNKTQLWHDRYSTINALIAFETDYGLRTIELKNDSSNTWINVDGHGFNIYFKKTRDRFGEHIITVHSENRGIGKKLHIIDGLDLDTYTKITKPFVVEDDDLWLYRKVSNYHTTERKNILSNWITPLGIGSWTEFEFSPDFNLKYEASFNFTNAEDVYINNIYENTARQNRGFAGDWPIAFTNESPPGQSSIRVSTGIPTSPGFRPTFPIKKFYYLMKQTNYEVSGTIAIQMDVDVSYKKTTKWYCSRSEAEADNSITGSYIIKRKRVPSAGNGKKLAKIKYTDERGTEKTLTLKPIPKLNGGIHNFQGNYIHHTTDLTVTKSGAHLLDDPIKYIYSQDNTHLSYFNIMENTNDFTHFKIKYLFQRTFSNQMNFADGATYEIDSHSNGYALCDMEFRKKSDGNWQFKINSMPAAGPGLSSTYYNGQGLTATHHVWHDVYAYTANGPGYQYGRLFGFRYISSYWWVFLGDSANPKITLVCDYGHQGMSAIPYYFEDLS